ncbi:LysR family transcriptional regulator [Sinimarinibacterium sp. CAU 1509]|uniref:LysR family transcriptional regulator n=1 Tax=Sinimarinibacterium sp. CAU 1509 TaxID=2562283 RepID=UPI0010AC0821|nr:LysR family transcriptional regulator [Sinimarinibacterium sp. CAU 1509]TJY59302.1 LysR family transcriptional regulator [Sinimarinibacterium sp. CAU 1509]
MSHSELDWNDIPLLLALARSGSMSAAARSLGVDVSTISRRVAAAEAALQTPLFIRSHRGYQPTDAGAVFITRAEQVQGDVRALLLETRAEAEGIHGPVRLTAVDTLFDHWLVERLPALLQPHPELQLQLIADDGNLSFTRREADLALRLARPNADAALLMRKLGDIGLAVFGSKRFASVRRAQWGTQPWLAYNDELSGVPEMQWLAQLEPSPRRIVKVSSATTLVRACEAGLGLALLPCFIGAQQRLQRLSKKPELHRELWLLSHRDAANIRRFRVVADWLAQVFEADRDVLSG